MSTQLVTRLNYYKTRINILSGSPRDALTIASILHILRELSRMTLSPWHLEESCIHIEVKNLASGDGVVQTAAGDLLCKWESEGFNIENLIQDPAINSNNTQASKVSSYYSDQKLIRLRKQAKINDIN